MKLLAFLGLSALTAAAPLAAAQQVLLPGVSDEETTIRSGVVEEFVQGDGDVLFVRDRINRWYRVQLNDGCLSNSPPVNGLAFERNAATQSIDHFSKVRIGGTGRVCGIESIRRSATPPQKDSDSPVTLD